MFGYVVPDKPNMFVKDFTLYRAYYCGLCKSIGKKCGQCMRFATNYDTTFLNILLHGVLDVAPCIKSQNCILSPFKRKPIVCDDALSRKVVDVNTILANYKLTDDIIDSKSFPKKMLRLTFISKKFKKAKAAMPEIDSIVSENYNKLRTLERANCPSLDMVAEPFGIMLRDVCKLLTGQNYSEDLGQLMFFVGKWIYTVDAIDDIEEDSKKNNYNPFLAEYKFVSREKFLEDKGEDAKFALMTDYAKIKDSFANIQLAQNEGVVTNILWYGILAKTNEILGRDSQCKKTRFQF